MVTFIIFFKLNSFSKKQIFETIILAKLNKKQTPAPLAELENTLNFVRKPKKRITVPIKIKNKSNEHILL